MTSKNYAAILFDLDGTLLDSAAGLHHCLNKLLIKHQQSLVALSEVQRKLNDGAMGLIQLGFGENQTAEHHQLLRNELLNYYDQFLHEQTSHFFPGSLALLAQLSKKKIPWGIVTNKQQRFTQAILRNAGLLNQASVVICGDMVSAPKPAAESILMATQQLAVKPADCCYVGDSLNDLIAAKNAGMPGFLACWGYWQILHYSVQHWPYTKIFYRPEDFLLETKF